MIDHDIHLCEYIFMVYQVRNFSMQQFISGHLCKCDNFYNINRKSQCCYVVLRKGPIADYISQRISHATGPKPMGSSSQHMNIAI